MQDDAYKLTGSFSIKNLTADGSVSYFFQNEVIFVQLDLDELDQLDRITHASIGFNYSLTQPPKTLWCNGYSG